MLLRDHGLAHKVLMAAKSLNSSRVARIVVYVFVAMFACTFSSAQSTAQHVQTSTRKLKSGAPPEYPELARRMRLEGTARVLLTVSPDGGVSNIKELGGNPVLVASLVQAVKKWKYEPADHTTEIEVKFEFTQGH
jgi:TonB family protein